MLRTEVVRTESELLGLEEDWRALLQDAQVVSIFLTWEWITTWWRHYGHEHSLYIVAVWDTTGALVGVAPFMLVKSGWGPVVLRRLTFIGTGIVYPAHLDIIARADDRHAVARAVLFCLQDRQREWDMLEFISLSQDSPLKAYLAEASGHYAKGYSMPCPYVSLPDNWDTYQEQFISSSLRKNIAHSRRRLEREYPGQVAFETVTDDEQLLAAMSALRDMHVRRWTALGQTTPFEDDRYMTFQLDAASAALARGWLRLSTLRVGGEIAAVNLSFLYGHVHYGYQRAFDAEWGKYSPGWLLMAHVLEAAICEGARELDMLHGAQGDKDQWGSTLRMDLRLRFSSDLIGNAVLAGTALLDNAVRVSREHLPESVRQRASRLLPQMQW